MRKQESKSLATPCLAIPPSYLTLQRQAAEATCRDMATTKKLDDCAARFQATLSGFVDHSSELEGLPAFVRECHAFLDSQPSHDVG